MGRGTVVPVEVSITPLPKEAGPVGALGYDDAEEADGRKRQKHTANQVEALPEGRAAHHAEHEGAHVPKPGVGREDSEKPPIALAVRSEQDARGKGEAQQRRDERGLSPRVHGASVTAPLASVSC